MKIINFGTRKITKSTLTLISTSTTDITMFKSNCAWKLKPILLVLMLSLLGAGNAWAFDHGQHYGRANVAVATGSTGSGTVYIGNPGTTSATWDCKGSASDGSSANDTKSYNCTCTGWADGYYFAGWNQNAITAGSYSSTSATATLSFGTAAGTKDSPTNIYYYAWILGVKPTAAAGDVSFNVDNLSTTLTKTVSFTQTGGDAQADFNNATITLKSGGGTWTHTSTTYNGSTKKVDVVFTYKSNRSTWTNAAGTRTDKATLTLSSKGNESFSTEITASLPNVSISAGSGGSITRSNATATETGSVTFPVTYVDNKDDLNTPTIAKTSGEGTWTITGYSYSTNTVTVNYSHAGDGTYGSRASAATITLSAKAGGATNTCNVTATYPAIAVTGGDDTGAYPLGTEDALGTATFFVSHADALTDFTIPTAVTDITGGTWTVNAGSAVYTQSTSDPTTGTLTIDYTYNAGDIIGVKTAKLTLTSSNGSSYALTLTGERAAAAEQDVSVTTAGGVTTNYDTWAAGLAAANAADGCTLKLLRDVSGLTASQEITKNMKLDLNHFTLSGTLSAAGGLLKLNTAGKTLTITDGKSDGAISVSGNINGRVSAVDIQKGSLVLAKGDLTATNANTGATQANIYVATVYLAASTNMTMTAGNITARRTGASGNYCHGIYCAGTGASASSVNLTGGTITSDFANGGYAIGVYSAGTSIIKDMTISGSAKTCAYAIWAQDGQLAVNGGTLSGTTSTSTARALYTKTNPATKNAVVVNNAILNATAGTTDAKGVYCQSTSATISGDPTDANIILSNVTVDAKTTGTTNAFAIFTDPGVCLLVNSGDYSATAQTTNAYAVQSSGYTAIVNGTFNATANYIARAINVAAGITAVRNGSFTATAQTEQVHATYVASGSKLLVYGGTFHGICTSIKAGSWATGTLVQGELEAQGGTFIGEAAKDGLTANQNSFAAGMYVYSGSKVSLANATLSGELKSTYLTNGGNASTSGGAYGVYSATANPLAITNSTLTATSAYQAGFGIMLNNTPAEIKNTTIEVNTTKAYNYGIFATGTANVQVDNSTIAAVSGTMYAYGAYLNNGTLTATNTSFSAETKRTGASSADNCQLYGIYVNKGKSATLNGCTITATGSGSYSNNGYGVYVDGSADIEDCAVTVSNINSGAYAICNTGNTTAINVASGKFKAVATTGTIVGTNATAAATKQKLYGGYYVHNTNLEKYLPEGYGIETLPTTSTEYKEGYRYAIRATTNIDPVCKIGATPYSTLEEALEFVNKNSGTAYTILMVKNYTLPAGDYTLPAKAQLLVPRIASQTAFETTYKNIVKYGEYTTPSAFRTLTFASGVHFDAKGDIQVASLISSKGQMNGQNGTPSGPHGKIVLQENSKLILESGAELYAWGYVTGAGTIDAKSGSKVYESMQIRDWRGGSNTRNIYSSVFPFNQYFIQNVESKIRFRPGSEEIAYGSVNASSSAYSVQTKLIGTSDALFLMSTADVSEDTWVQKSYDYSTDYQVYEVNSAAQLSNLIVSGLPIIGSINSASYTLPIVNNMHIHLLSGKLEVIQDVLLQPGVIIEIDKEAKCVMKSGKKMYVQDSEDTQGYDYSLSFNTIPYTPQGSVSGKRTLKDASINMHGTFEFNGYLYTSEHGANIFSTNEDAGTIIFKNSAPSNATLKICNTGGTIVSKTFTTPQLKNADGETPAFTSTSGSVANDEYAYYLNQWRKWVSSGCFTIDKTDNSNWKYYAKPAEYVQLSSNTEDANHLYHDAATGTRAFILEDGCLWWEVEPTPYDGNKYKCITPDYDGRYKYYEYKSGAWQEATVTVTWSINGDNTNYTVLYGTHPKYLSASPSKTATASEYYTWIGWTQGSTEGTFYAKDAELPVVTSNTTYYAYFETHKYSYTVQFKNYDGAVLQATRWEADQTPYYMGDTDPIKPATTALVYTFTGWSPAFTPVTASGNKTYTAQFDAGTARKYTIQWVNYNGTVLKEEEVAYGTIPTAPTTPTRPNDDFYTYTFNSWSPAITSVSGNQTYTATYDYSQKVTKFDIIFKNGTETIYSQSLPNGETPVYGGSTPTKDETAQYTYTFDGWSATEGGAKITGALPVVSGAGKTYYAVYTHTTRKYTIRWKSEDGKVLYETDTNVPYGTTPSFDGGTPTKQRMGAIVYTFDGWSSTIGGPKIALPSVAGNATYYAHFSDLPVYTLTFNANGHGTAPAAQEVVSGQKAIEPADPTAEGYLFGGWYKEATCTNAWNFSTDVVSADRSLFAKWTEAVASVTTEDDVTTYYATIAGAITFANSKTNAVVKMLKNASVASEIKISATMTINLNGKTISSTLATATGVFNINASGKTVTIRDSQTGGKIDHTASYSDGYLYGVNLTAGTLNIESGNIYAKNTANNRAYGIYNAGSTNLNISGGTIIEATSSNSPFGIYDNSNCTLTMTGGTFTASGSGSRGIYTKGTTTLTNATITASGTSSYAIFAKAGTMTINSGTYTATETSSYAIYYEAGTVTVKDGRFSGAAGELKPKTTYGTSVKLQGGYYVHNTDLEDNCATNYHALPLTDEDTYKFEVAEAYTISFINEGTQLQSGYVKKGATPTYTGSKPTKLADAQYTYSFSGWSPAIGPVTSAKEYTATYSSTINKYSVTFNLQGHGAAIDAQTIDYGSRVTKPADPSEAGYTFVGWYKEDACTNAWNFASDEVTGTTILYAKWTVNQYTITFNTNGGSAVASITQDYGSVVTAPANPTKEGYTFNVWLPAVPATMPIDGTTCVAQWTVNNYTISYDLAGGSVASVNPTSYTIETTTFTLTNPTREGYTFAGWTGTGLASATTTVTIAEGSTGGRNYTATWTPVDYTITYELAGGSVASANPTSYTIETATFTLTNPTREGYTFAGWTGTDLDAATTSVSIAQGSTGNRSYNATWTINNIAITWVDGNGVSHEADVTYGTTPGAPAEAKVKAPNEDYTYEFTGWDKAVVAATVPTTYTAQFNTVERTYGSEYRLDIVDWSDNTASGTITLNMNGYTLPRAKTNWKVVFGNSYTKAQRDSETRLLSITGANLSTAGSNLTIKVYDYKEGSTSEYECVSRQHYQVPIVVNSTADLSTLSPAATSDVWVRNGATLTVSGKQTLKTVRVDAGCALMINEGAELTITESIILRTRTHVNVAYRAPELINKGTLTLTGKAKFYYSRIVADKQHLYPIGFPFKVDLTKVTLTNGTASRGTDFAIQYYDGESRAVNGVGGNWKLYSKNDEDPKTNFLTAKQGYLLLSTSAYYREYLFPMDYSKSPEASVNVTPYPSSRSAADEGWNVVVSPFTSTSYITAQNPSQNLKISKLYEDNVNYYQDVARDLEPAVPFYLQVHVENSGTQVENPVTLSFAATSSPIVRRRAHAYTSSSNGVDYSDNSVSEQWIRLMFSLTSNSASGLSKDITNIFLHPTRFSADYETELDVVKLTTSGSKPLVYTSLSCGDLAFAAVPDDMAQAGLPITVNAPVDGDYLFSVEQGEYLERLDHLYLHDAEWDDLIDLLSTDYIIDLTKGVTRNRFTLRAVFRQPGIATDLDNLNGGLSNGENGANGENGGLLNGGNGANGENGGLLNGGNGANGAQPRKVYHDGYIYIILPNGTVYDTNGKRVERL